MDFLSVLSSESRKPSSFISTLLIGLAVMLILKRFLRPSRSRSLKVPHRQERVVILGASSGIGCAIAHEYAARGARVCVVARREAELANVAEECRALCQSEAVDASRVSSMTMLSCTADFTNVEDMVRVRDVVETEWKGIDTLVVSAGVLSKRPLLEVAGLERHGATFSPAQASVEGIQHIVDVANAAVKGNYVGPLVSAVTFIPLLASTSVSPSILLISTLAAVTPPPTRSLYASTKTASLMLYSVLAIEHPTITFTHFLPSSVEGDFGASAVDTKTVQQRGTMTPGLKRDVVARRCLRAVDAGERMVFMPAIMGRAAQIGTVLFPAVIEWLACRRYRFSAA